MPVFALMERAGATEELKAASLTGPWTPDRLPDLWSFWLPYDLVLAALQVVFSLVLVRRGRWTWPFVGVAGLLDLAFAAPAMWLILDGRLLNQAFFGEVSWPEGGHPTGGAALAIALGIAVVAVRDLIDKGLKAWRADRAAGGQAASSKLA